MFKITRLIGSLLLMLWFALMNGVVNVIPAPYESYGEILLNNKWAFLIVGVVLSIYSFNAEWKKRRQKYKASEYDNGSKQGNIQKQNFVKEQQEYKATEFVQKNNFKNKDLALKVDWIPLSPGGANFKTSKLVKLDAGRIEVVRSIGMFIFAGVFILMGIIMPLVIGYSNYKDSESGGMMLGLSVFGLIFTGAGALMMYFPRPRIFDKSNGWFWVGNKSLDKERDFMQLKKSARLSEVVAIQILSEYVSGNKSSYTSWEINLVSKDAQRMNVLDHGNLKSVLEDAQLLGDFLGVPVWENS